MPHYEYRCPDCAAEFTLTRPIAERDDLTFCFHCLGDDWFVYLQRVPSAPNFVIGGYNTKNGYSKG